MNFMEAALSASGDSCALDGIDTPLTLSARNRDALKGMAGKSVCLGIRPEHIELPGREIPGGTITGTIDVVEPLGAEIHLYIVAGSHSFIAVVPARNMYKVGQTVPVRLDPEHVTFFDTETERVIVGEDDKAAGTD